MPTTARPEAWWDAASLGRALVLLTALAGLFAMHGLSDHTTADHVYVADSQMTSSMHVQLGPAPSRLPDPLADSVSARPASGHMGETDLCVAVLGAGLMMLLIRVRRPVAQLARETRPLRRVRTRPRAPDPPDLVRLSIQRC